MFLIDFHHQPSLWTIAAQPSAINYNNNHRYVIKLTRVSGMRQKNVNLFSSVCPMKVCLDARAVYFMKTPKILTLILLVFCSLVPDFSHQKGGSISRPTRYSCHLKNVHSSFFDSIPLKYSALSFLLVLWKAFQSKIWKECFLLMGLLDINLYLPKNFHTFWLCIQ